MACGYLFYAGSRSTIIIFDPMPDLSNFAPYRKRSGHLKTYLYIAAFTAVNGLYFGLRDFHKRPKYEVFNGGKIVSFHQKDSSDSTCFLLYSYQLGASFAIDSMKLNKGFLKISPYLIGRNFPILVNAKDNKDRVLLFFPEEFKKFEVPFPDSLKWVTQLLP